MRQKNEYNGVNASTNEVPTPTALLERVAGVDTETATRLLASYGSLAALQGIDARSLRTAHGFTRRQAERLSDAVAFASCLIREPCDGRPQVRSPQDAARLVLPEMGLLEAEEMRVLLLDAKNHVHGVVTLYHGTITTCMVRVAEVFRTATRRNAAGLIVVHNHPSHDPTPSDDDIGLTRELVSAGRLLGVEVHDHLIIGGSDFISLRERGVGWE